MRLPRFATIRIVLLLACLLVVAFTSVHQRIHSRNWNQTLEAVVYPINGDGLAATERYIQSLGQEHFSSINRWGEREAERHNLPLPTPFNVTLGDRIHTQPPMFPDTPNWLTVLAWGLRLRWWAWHNTPDDGTLTRVRMFVVYQVGEDNQPLRHSLGLQKGLIGLVYAFSRDEQAPQNNIVIAHELLHTVGAADKYNRNGGPLMYTGYANPTRIPLYPQRHAEIMSGTIPTSASSAYMAESLRSVIINSYTAREINWLD